MIRERRVKVLTLGGLFLLFVGPLLLATVLYLNPSWVPEGRTNHGYLLEPQVSLQMPPLQALDGDAVTADVLEGRWTFLYLDHAACDAACEHNLYKMRQVRLAQGKDMNRVQRLFVLTQGESDARLQDLLREHPGLLVARAPGEGVAAFRRQLPAADGHIFLVDPRGNVVLMYPSDADPRDILDDLKHLLRVSRIG
ncbi:SCO family protein [Ectothiorhodospiraceae bacterium 2226]|nr:SCO family protein [Ectothiorhodospiraceae bacterium 2226]